jgi:hypothetical protein
VDGNYYDWKDQSCLADILFLTHHVDLFEVDIIALSTSWCQYNITHLSRHFCWKKLDFYSLIMPDSLPGLGDAAEVFIFASTRQAFSFLRHS